MVSSKYCGGVPVASRDPDGWLPRALPAVCSVWLQNEWPAAKSRRGGARGGAGGAVVVGDGDRVVLLSGVHMAQPNGGRGRRRAGSQPRHTLLRGHQRLHPARAASVQLISRPRTFRRLAGADLRQVPRDN